MPSAAVMQTAVEDGSLPRPEWLPETVPTFAFRLAIVVVVLVVAYYVSKILPKLLARRITRQFDRPSVAQMVLHLIQISVITLGILSALSIFGLGLGNVVLSVGVFSAVVGIVLAPVIGSVLSGVFILTEQPYEIGDMIEIEDTDTRGFVEDITLMYTKVFTLENTFIVLPNGEMRGRDVVNYSAEDTRIRLSLDLDITYQSDVEEARSLLENAAREVEEVISGGPDIRIGSSRYPASPTSYIREFGDHGVHLQLRYWAREPYKLPAVRSAVNENVWARIPDADVEIPYPHSHLVFDDTSGELQVGVHDVDEGAKAQSPAATSHSASSEASDSMDAATASSADGESESGDSSTEGAVEDTDE